MTTLNETPHGSLVRIPVEIQRQRWLMGFAAVIPFGYLLFFALTWTRVGPKDFDQFLVFHQLQYWNHSLFGFAKQWTPLLCSGLSMAGEPQVPLMSLSMMLSYLVGPFYGIKLACIAYLIIGWWGAYLYAGLWQTERLVRILAASLFIGNGFFFYRLAVGHIDFVPFLVLPFALWMLHQSLHWQRHTRWLPNCIHAALMVAVFGGAIAMVVDGSPVAVIHLLFWIGLYALVLAFHARSLLPLAFLSAATALATVLDAGYLLPMLSAQAEFPRQTANVFTDPTGLLLHALLPIRGKLTHGIGKGHEMTVFIGPVLALLLWRYRVALRAAIPAEMFKPLWVVSAVSIVLGMGSLSSLHVPVWLSPFDLLRPLPGFRSIGVTARYWGFLAVPLSLLGAVVLSWFVREQPLRRVALWLSIAVVFQIGSQADAFLAHWSSGRKYTEASVLDYFHGRAESVSYVNAPEPHWQGEFITPRRGVANCYDMDDFVRAPVAPGAPMIAAQFSHASDVREATLFERQPLNLQTHPVAVDFASWNHLHLQANGKDSIPADVQRTVVLNQAWNSHWSAPGCTVLRDEQNRLTVRCSEQQLRTGVEVQFHDELSSVSATVSKRAWRWLLTLMSVCLAAVV